MRTFTLLLALMLTALVVAGIVQDGLTNRKEREHVLDSSSPQHPLRASDWVDRYRPPEAGTRRAASLSPVAAKAAPAAVEALPGIRSPDGDPVGYNGERSARERWRPLLERYADWPVDEALLVILGPTPRCPTGESTGNPLAVGSAGERGLMQLAAVHAWRFARRGWTWDDAFDPERNIAIAHEIYLESGWQPWTCRP